MPEIDLQPAANLTARWVSHWRADPARRTLRDTDGRWLTAGEIEQRTSALARGPVAAGIDHGTRVLLVAEPSVRFVLAYVAALRAGLTVVPINPAATPAEVARVSGAASPATAVALDDLDRGAAGLGRGDAGLGRGDAEIPLDAAAPDDVALLIFTSGTTGAPKGVPLTHANLLASATAVAHAWEWTAEDRLLLALPLFHVHGLGVGLHGSFGAGGSVVLRPRFDAADVAEHAGEATMFFGVPATYDRLVRADRTGALRPLRLIVSGSAPLPAALADAVASAAGQMPLERYGMTETIMLTGNPYVGERRPGTVGVPFPGVELRLGDAGADAGAGAGEIEVRGPNVISGYLDAPVRIGDAFTADGWFRTGDIGTLDADGYLRIVGRSKELIITGGENVMPREVEEVIAAFPGVQEVAVVGRPSERWGEEVTAVLVADTPLDPEALRAFAATQLTAYKVPKRIEFADALPRNALGKIVRGEL